MPSRALVPSLSFHPTPTVYSTHGFAGLLHPADDPGVRRVSISAGVGCLKIPRATVAELSSTAHALRSFSLASSRDHVTMTRAFSPLVPNTASTAPLRAPPIPHQFLNLKAFFHWRSRCERSTVASRVLPVASLGFSFWSASCPTRRSWSYGLPLQCKTATGAFSIHPRGKPPGPTATVADGVDRPQRDVAITWSRRAARSEERRSQRDGRCRIAPPPPALFSLREESRPIRLRYRGRPVSFCMPQYPQHPKMLFRPVRFVYGEPANHVTRTLAIPQKGFSCLGCPRVGQGALYVPSHRFYATVQLCIGRIDFVACRHVVLSPAPRQPGL